MLHRRYARRRDIVVLHRRLHGRDDAVHGIHPMSHGSFRRRIQRIQRHLYDVEVHTEPVGRRSSDHEEVPDRMEDRFPFAQNEETDADDVESASDEQQPQSFLLNHC